MRPDQGFGSGSADPSMLEIALHELRELRGVTQETASRPTGRESGQREADRDGDIAVMRDREGVGGVHPEASGHRGDGFDVSVAVAVAFGVAVSSSRLGRRESLSYTWPVLAITKRAWRIRLDGERSARTGVSSAG